MDQQGKSVVLSGWTRVAGVAGACALVLGAAAMIASAAGAPAAKSANARSRAALIARGKQISFSSGCQDCHTPGTFYGSTDMTRMLSGSELGWEGPWGVTYPRNLTPDPETGIASWSEKDIITAFRTGHRPDQTLILPPMPWPQYAQMSDADAHALATFIKSIPPVKHKVPDRQPPGAAATGARLTFPPPPAWDAMNLPKPPDAK